LLSTFHEAARSELAEAIAFYNDREAGLGDSLGAEVAATVDRIVENPGAGRLMRPEIRRRLLKRFPYSLLYHASSGRVQIVAVMHHRSDPEYWTDRK
jgi:plasmid stabilization system protein ParE